ncbi:MAG: hypothetical protein FWB79_05260 [Treponema sp.]|nr:hypothetical protein [Treponema sp.]
MTVKKRPAALVLLLALSAANLAAQTGVESDVGTSSWPGWLRDVRRWEIVAFGSFPFTMFFATIGMDMFRWQNHNGMDFSDRSHAPWPLKSAGAVAMTDEEQRRTILMAVGLSATIAIADHIIVQSRRRRDRRRAEAIPSGTIVVTRTPLEAEPVDYGDAGYGIPDYGDPEEAAPPP